MANEIQQQNVTADSTTIAKWLDDKDVTAQIAGALGGYIDVNAFRSQCALAALDPNLLKCNLQSLLAAFLKCAQMGLIPGKHHNHVALIPRKSGDVYIVDAMPQWQGFKFIMEQQDGIRRVTPILVHFTDNFSFTNGELVHSYDPFDSEREFKHPSDCKDGKTGLRGAYVKIESRNEPERYHFMSAAAIEKRRMCSQTPDLDRDNRPGVWRKWYAEQCLKTVLRDAWSRRAVSIDPTIAEKIGEAAGTDDVVLGNDPARIVESPRAALPAPTDGTPVGFTDDNERKAFMAKLGELGVKYDDVKAHRESQGKVKPSLLTADQRVMLLKAMTPGNKPRRDFDAWLAQRATKLVPATVPLSDAEFEPTPTEQIMHGNGCGVCGGAGDLRMGVCFTCASDPKKDAACREAAAKWHEQNDLPM